MNERRNYIRVPTDEVLMVQIPNHPNIEKIGFYEILTPESIDISEGGLQVEGIQKLPVGIYLIILLSIASLKNPIEVEGKVVWCNKADKKEHYKMGIEFIDFKDKSKKKIIQEYIKKR